MKYLEIKNISKKYGQNYILDNINLNLEKGEVCSILGRSGTGKTTLFNILAGFEMQDSGEIYFKNRRLETNTFEKDIAYMQQNHLLLPNLTIFENICLPMKIKGLNKDEIKNTVLGTLDEFNLLHIKDKYAHQISGGMQQRVSFIRAYLKTKDLILLDEPFSSLDYITKFQIYDWLKKTIEKHKITILFITHDIQEAILLSDKIYVMNKNLSDKTFYIKRDTHNLTDFLHSEQFSKYLKTIFDKI